MAIKSNQEFKLEEHEPLEAGELLGVDSSGYLGTLSDSNYLKKDESNLIQSNFDITDGVNRLFMGSNYLTVDINGMADVKFEEYGIRFTDLGTDNYVWLHSVGVQGFNPSNSTGWSIYKDTDIIGDSYLTMPITGFTSRTIPISVNGSFANANGDIDGEAVVMPVVMPLLGNYLKKNESNLVTDDFSITNGGQTMVLNGEYSVEFDSPHATTTINSDDGYAIQYSQYDNSSVDLHRRGVSGSIGGSITWRLDKNSSDTEQSNLIFPQTGTTGRRLAISVDGEFADENGNIELDRGVANGLATLDGGGKVPASQLPNSVMTLEGEWNASTNTPTLTDGVGNAGMVYEVTTAGTQDLGSGNITFKVGDFAIYGADGKWFLSKNSNEVVSVNGKTGMVDLSFSDLSNKPTTISGYGITDAMSTAHPANTITNTNKTNWDSAYSYSQVGHVPYTGANEGIDFNTQDLTLGGYTNKLSTYFERINLINDAITGGNFKLLTNVAAQQKGSADAETGDIVITLPIRGNTNWQVEIDILGGAYRATLNVQGSGVSNGQRKVQGVFGDIDGVLEVKFGRIENNTVLIIKRANSTLNRLQVNLSKFYYHHGDNADLYNDKSKYKVEYIKEEDLVGFTLNGTILNEDFVRDPFYLDYNNLNNKPTIPTVGNGEIKYTGTGAITGGGVSTANQSGNTSYTLDLTTATKDRIGEGVTAFGWGDHASQGYLKGLRIVVPNNIVVPAGDFDVELLDHCPLFDLSEFSSWGIVIKTITTGKVTLTSIRDIEGLSSLSINKFDTGALCFFLSGRSKDNITIPAGSIISLNK